MIPPFRISEDAIEKDAEILRKMQVDIHCNTKLESFGRTEKAGIYKDRTGSGSSGFRGSLKLESGMPKMHWNFWQNLNRQTVRFHLENMWLLSEAETQPWILQERQNETQAWSMFI